MSTRYRGSGCEEHNIKDSTIVGETKDGWCEVRMNPGSFKSFTKIHVKIMFEVLSF
jgi:hypothetical protein